MTITKAAAAGFAIAAAAAFTPITLLTTPLASADNCETVLKNNPVISANGGGPYFLQQCRKNEGTAIDPPQGCSNNPFSSLPNCGTPCSGDTVVGPGGVVQHNPPGCDPNAPR